MSKWVKRILVIAIAVIVLFVAAVVLWMALDFGGFKAFLAG